MTKSFNARKTTNGKYIYIFRSTIVEATEINKPKSMATI